MRNTTRDDTDAVIAAGYQPDWVETTGRKLKMEYLGMGSVFAIIFKLAFSGLPHPYQAAIATTGTLLLFMGLKKKTRDHISASFLLFLAAALASQGVTAGLWFAPYALFGACIWAMEGYLEKRRSRINTLPIVIAGFAAVSPWWPLALAFVATYLLEPRPESPKIRTRLAWMVALSTVAALAVAFTIGARDNAASWVLVRPAHGLLVMYACVAAVGLACVAVYWKRLPLPHRLNALLVGLLAPVGAEIIAMAGMVWVVLLSATIFRHSIDSDRLRPFFKHAEWYFFPIVLVAALSIMCIF